MKSFLLFRLFSCGFFRQIKWQPPPAFNGKGNCLHCTCNCKYEAGWKPALCFSTCTATENFPRTLCFLKAFAFLCLFCLQQWNETSFLLQSFDSFFLKSKKNCCLFCRKEWTLQTSLAFQGEPGPLYRWRQCSNLPILAVVGDEIRWFAFSSRQAKDLRASKRPEISPGKGWNYCDSLAA